MSKRKANGEGTIFKRKQTGLYYASITIYDPSGKRKRISISAKTRTEAHRKLVELQVAQQSGRTIAPTHTTVAQFLDRWLNDVARPTVRQTTFRDYESIVRVHLLPRLGRTLLHKLVAPDIARMLSTMEENGATARTRHKVRTILHVALEHAMRWDLVGRNVCAQVSPPRISTERVEPFSADEVRQFLDTAVGDRLHALYVLAIATGLRQGELFGLHWNNIDLERRVLRVTHALQEVKGGQVRGEPKTMHARRNVVLPDFAVQALVAHQARMLAEGHGSQWVFCNADGGPLWKSNFTRRSFRPLLTRAKLRRIRFHDLRHTAATLLFAAGQHPKVVQERLGHSQIGVTMNLYTHHVPSIQQAAAEALDDLLVLKNSATLDLRSRFMG